MHRRCKIASLKVDHPVATKIGAIEAVSVALTRGVGIKADAIGVKPLNCSRARCRACTLCTVSRCTAGIVALMIGDLARSQASDDDGH
jgi:hypothetical protein